MQSQDPLLGLLVDGRFEVLERIGSGGMGTVYRPASSASIGMWRSVHP
jgi:hypothetical protein